MHVERGLEEATAGLYARDVFMVLAGHHLRLADRSGSPVVFVFVRLDKLEETVIAEGQDASGQLIADAAEVVLDAVRASDVPSRIADDTFCILLSGEARGAESLVLSRLVEAIATRGSRGGDARSLALSVGSALYDPAAPQPLERILETAMRGMQRGPDASADP